MRAKVEVKVLIVSLLFSSYLYSSEYCIQAASVQLSDGELLVKKTKEIFYLFPYTRVERIGNYNVLRMGRFGSYTDAKKLLYEVRKYMPDSYVRKCDWIPSRVVYDIMSHSNNRPSDNDSLITRDSYEDSKREFYKQKREASLDSDHLFCPIECIGLDTSQSFKTYPISEDTYKQVIEVDDYSKREESALYERKGNNKRDLNDRLYDRSRDSVYSESKRVFIKEDDSKEDVEYIKSQKLLPKPIQDVDRKPPEVYIEKPKSKIDEKGDFWDEILDD